MGYGSGRAHSACKIDLIEKNMKVLCLASAGLALVMTGCALDTGKEAAKDNISDAASMSTQSAAIDPAIYSRIDDPSDPYRHVYAEFRERRATDMKNPDLPEPLEYYQATHFTRNMPWTPLDEILNFDWAQMDSDRVQDLKAAIKMRLGFDHPDLKITQIMIGQGGVLPAHADGAPGVYIGVGGFGEVTREGKTQSLSPGTTVKLNPYDIRRVAATGEGPVKLLWIRWAPGGDQSFFGAGYYLTGANQHLQPEGSEMPKDYKFWGADFRTVPIQSPKVPLSMAEPGSFYERQNGQLDHKRLQLGNARDLYPATPAFGHESYKTFLNIVNN